MAEARYDVAVVGAAGAVGAAIIALLEERAFPVGRLFPLDREQASGNKVDFRGHYLTIRALEYFDFSQARIAFFAAGEGVAADYAAKAVTAGCVVIDNSAQFRLAGDVPLVVPEVNPQALAGQPRLIASPAPITTLLLLALKPLYDAAGIARVNVASYQSVSELGQEAVDELASQTVALLNLQDVKREVFASQIAFNVLGQIGAVESNGYTGDEMKMLHESQKVLGDDAILINATAVRVPVFFGDAAAVHLETRDKLDAAQARAILQATAGISVLMPATETVGFPNPVDHAAGADAVFVGRVRDDLSHAHGLDLWLVADNIRRCAALNSVQIAEFLVKDRSSAIVASDSAP